MALPLCLSLLHQNWEVKQPSMEGMSVMSEKVAIGLTSPRTYLNQ